jgi:hypothetical protein
MIKVASLVGTSTRRHVVAAIYAAIGAACIMALWNVMLGQSPARGWDFPVFYIAARLPIHSLYDRSAFLSFWQRELQPIGVPHWAPYVRLSVFSFLITPLALFPFYRALYLWFAIGVGAYFASVGLLIYRFRLSAMLVLVYAAFFPAIGGLYSGQDNALYLLALALAVCALESHRDWVAGALLVLTLCKFNLIVLVPVVLLLHRRYRALFMLSMGAVGVFGMSFALTPFRTYVSAITQAQQKTPFFFPVGLRGFSTSIGEPSFYPFLAGATFILCCWLIKKLPLWEAFCVGITGALLISPYITWYDSTLLAFPLAVIYARSRFVLQIGCTLILSAVPLWMNGGGYNGPKGFMHVSVELFIIGYFLWNALLYTTGSLAVPTMNDQEEAVA